MKHFLVVPVLSAILAVAVAFHAAAAAEVVIDAPGSVPVGGLCMVRVSGLDKDSSFAWTAVPDVQTADLMQRDGTPVLFVATDKPGRYWLVLAYVNGGGQVRQQISTVTIGGDPGPGPLPPDPPGPPPIPPGPAGLRVLILRETADSTPLAVIASTQVREYLNTHAAKGADGKTPEWRIWDDDYTADQLANMPQAWRDAFADAKQRAAGHYPWIHVSNGQAGYSGPLPATVEETLTLLKKYGGA